MEILYGQVRRFVSYSLVSDGETTNCTSDQVQGDDLTASHSNYQCHTSADQQTREVTHTHSKNGTSLVVSSYEKADVATGRLVVSLGKLQNAINPCIHYLGLEENCTRIQYSRFSVSCNHFALCR